MSRRARRHLSSRVHSAGVFLNSLLKNRSSWRRETGHNAAISAGRNRASRASISQSSTRWSRPLKGACARSRHRCSVAEPAPKQSQGNGTTKTQDTLQLANTSANLPRLVTRWHSLFNDKKLPFARRRFIDHTRVRKNCFSGALIPTRKVAQAPLAVKWCCSALYGAAHVPREPGCRQQAGALRPGIPVSVSRSKLQCQATLGLSLLL